MIGHEDVVELVKGGLSRVLKRWSIRGEATFFERFFTAMSFCYFADQKVDIAVIGNGMGAGWIPRM